MYETITKNVLVKSTKTGEPTVQKKPENKTGLPDRIKTGTETLSGMSLDDVRVHYNSAKPSQLKALAYTKGNEIYVAPGQEKYVAHEAWHVVQQKQSRVEPTVRINGINVNNSAELEREADVMGARAASMSEIPVNAVTVQRKSTGADCVQAAMPSVLLPADVNVGIYKGIDDNEIIEGKRTVKDSKDLIDYLDKCYKNILEDENHGLRRLVYDIKLVKRKVKRGEIKGGNKSVLKTAQDSMKQEVKSYEQEIYGAELNYINEETQSHFDKTKNKAKKMINDVLGKDNEYLKTYFRPKNGIVGWIQNLYANKDEFYNRVRANYRKISAKLPIIGFKNNYTEETGVYAYVYPSKSSRNPGTTVGRHNVQGTYIKSKMHEGKETGLKIRLSSGYRLAGETGTDSRPGTIIHEASHLILGTKDHAYGEDIYNLSPEKAINNADTYEYAAEKA